MEPARTASPPETVQLPVAERATPRARRSLNLGLLGNRACARLEIWLRPGNSRIVAPDPSQGLAHPVEICGRLAPGVHAAFRHLRNPNGCHVVAAS